MAGWLSGGFCARGGFVIDVEWTQLNCGGGREYHFDYEPRLVKVAKSKTVSDCYAEVAGLART
jgi:hypothetical protein